MSLDDDARHVRPFQDWLIEARKGKLARELSAALNELVEAVEAHGKGGRLTLTLDVKPATKGTSEMLTVTDNVQVKKPVADRGSSVWFVDDDRNLRRNDPRQQELPLREVPRADDTPPKEAQSHA